jgi:hypothetical protein
VEAPPLPFSSRIVFAWVCFFRVLLDAAFAGRAFAVRDAMPALPEPAAPKAKPRASIDPPEPTEEAKALKKKKVVEASRAPDEADAKKLREEGALWVLELLQREGRLVDFLEQDITSFGDEEVGAAVRVVHGGCKKALADHAVIEPIRAEKEGGPITLEEGFDKRANKLVGDVRGAPPYRGTLRHKGWRAKSIRLPTPTEGHDASVLAAAEVEL